MEKLQVDVVVMGSGAAGLGAAVAAAEGGAKVMVIEKRKVVGGISVTGLGIFAVESRLQHLKNVPLTRDEVFNIFMERTHWMADARLVRAYIDKTGSTIAWLEGMGVQFALADALPFPGALNQTGHIVKTPEGLRLMGGVTYHMIKAMKDRAEKLGVDIRLDTTVTKIVQNEGHISKVLAQDSKDSIEVSAKAVVIAAGGYVHDKEMMKKYGGFEVGKDFNLRSTIPLTGEGIKMAWELGAVPDGIFPYLAGVMGGGTKRESKGEFTGLSIILDLILAAGTPALWVNKDGMRFVNEGIYNMPYIANAVVRQKGKCCYNIVDSDIIDHLEKDGLDHILDVEVLPTNVTNFKDAMKRAMEEDKDRDDVFEADSIPELANKLGINPDVLQKTVDDYNKCCAKGHDDLMAKSREYLRPIKKAKFYAFTLSPSGLGTLGGVKINYKAEAINKDGDPIPGLYAAGDCANGAHAHDVSLVYLLWGSSLSFAVNSGRMAGESVAEYVNSQR